MDERLNFDEYVDIIRERLFDADAINDGELHSFRTLSEDIADQVPDSWYWQAFEELDAQGHLHSQSTLGNRRNAFARLSADGRAYVRAGRDG
jgi:hypothetical protein